MAAASLLRGLGAVRSAGARATGRCGDTLWRVARPHTPPGEPSARVTVEEAASDTYASASALAQAFGSTILEPSWWPADIEEISYCIARFFPRAHVEILSTRRDGVPVGVIGQLETPGGRSPRDWLDGEWSEPRELAHVRGLIGRIGIPTKLQAVIYDQDLEIHLIGYDTEDEIMSAVTGLRRVSPD